MHSELNKKQTINNDLKKEDYDENIAFNYFRKKYQDQNYSEIQEIFFGIKERIDNYNCCKLKKYSFEIFKYINFNIDQNLNAKNSNNLQNLISELETKENPDSKFCSMCYKDSEILTQQKLKKCPKILIITINNSNKKELQINSIIRTEKYEYKLICCIAESQIENDFNIIYYLKNSWNIIKEKDNNTGKEIGNEIGSLILYPCVLFFEKVDKKIAINDKNSNVSSIQSNFDNINPDIMSNSIYFNITNNLNINSNINNNNGKSFNNNVHKINIYNTKKSSKKLYQEKVNGRGDKNINKKIKRKYQKNKKYYNNIYDNKAINIMINKLNTNYFNNKINNNNQKKNIHNNPYKETLKTNNINIDTKINNSNKTNIDVKNILSQEMVINNNKFMNNNNYSIKNNLTMINKDIKVKNPSSKNINNNITNFNQNSNKIIQKNKINNSNLVNMKPNSLAFENQNVNTNIINHEKKTEDKYITLYFKFSNGKELYLDVKNIKTFSEVINELKYKYSWLQNIKIKNFLFKEKPIFPNKSLKEIGLEDNSTIYIIEE